MLLICTVAVIIKFNINERGEMMTTYEWIKVMIPPFPCKGCFFLRLQ